jgi:asparagine synthase (glutamine-hydrolysing)
MQTVYDEPFADPSAIPTFLVCRAARKYLKVVLAGDGGDELLAGYTYWYRPLLDMHELSSHDLRLAHAYRIMAALTRRVRLRIAASLSSRAAAVRAVKAHGTVARAHHHQNRYFSDGDLKALGLEPPPGPDWGRWASNTLDDALRMDLENYLPGDILVKTDRASMANSLELRAPFLDVDLASFCIRLPASLKIDSKADKLILRAACENLWPATVRRRGKQGFATPIHNWLAQDGLVQLGRQYLDSSSAKLYEVLPYAQTHRLARGESYQRWVLLVLALWLETRVTPAAPRQPALSLGRAGA